MLKINKIEKKELVKVAGQKNCTREGYSYKYEGQGDCLNDCTNVHKPRYYKAITH